VPAVITSDRGTQFTWAVWEALCNRLHIQHITTTAFHPCSNGMVERCHRQLKDALRAWSAANDWPDHLPWVLLGLRAAPKEDSAVSLAEMVLGDPLVLPGQPPTAGEPPPPQRSYRDALLEGPTRHVPTRPLPPAHSGLPAALAACTSVYIRRGGTLPPFAPLYAGPYPVLEWGEKVFWLQVGDREEAVRFLWTASSRTQGRSQCSRRCGRGEVGHQGWPPHPPLPPSDDSAEGGPVETSYL
jgi:hypothetical protein